MQVQRLLKKYSAKTIKKYSAKNIEKYSAKNIEKYSAKNIKKHFNAYFLVPKVNFFCEKKLRYF